MTRLALLLFPLLFTGPDTMGQSDWWFDSEEHQREVTGVDDREINERSFKERLTLGGTAAFQLGTNTLIGGAPQLGYRVNENLLAGAGVTYYFQRFKGVAGNVDNAIYGGNIFARHRLLTRIFAHVELEQVNLPNMWQIDPTGTDWTSMVWVGGGYYRGLSDRLGAGLTLLYDVTENPLNPYENPTIRGGIAVGF